METHAPKAVFLSYASQDAEAARRIAEALRPAGIEVWFDQEGGLEHGDEWDAKIRHQIKECVLFIALISANTQARLEGYFRIEWELAAERAMGIAHGVPFILPVVIDDTREPAALVPERFHKVQWMRLPGGNVTPEAKARFLKLWSHRTGALRHASEKVGAGPDDTVLTAVSAADGAGKRRLRIAFWAMRACVVVAAAVFVVGKLEKKAAPPATQTTVSATVPLSGARQLLAKVWGLLNKPELARAELDAATALCKQATTLDPTDADVWAAWSHAEVWHLYYAFDDSPGRRESARDKAARAMQLAPTSFEARLAQVNYWVRTYPPTTTGEVERILRALLQEQRDEPRALFLLGMLQFIRDPNSNDKGALERLENNPKFAVVASKEIGWQYFWAGRWAEANTAADRSIGLLPYWDNLALKIFLALVWFGDLDLAKATVDRMPQIALQEDAGVTYAFKVHWWRRQPKAILAALDSAPRDWIRANDIDGPKAFLVGQARQLAGQTEAARGEFRRALELIARRLADDPNNENLLGLKAQTLHHLGERTEAEKTYRLAREICPPELEVMILFESADVVITELESRFDRKPEKVYSGRWYWNLTAASLLLHPAYDSLRSHPRFAALLARAQSDPRKSPNPKLLATPPDPTP